MKNAKTRFLLTTILSIVILIVIASCSSSGSNSKNKKEVNDGNIQENTMTVPTFSAEEFKLITDPCTTITQANINLLVPGSVATGALQQNSVGPNKTCEWKINDVSFPRLGVSVIKSTDFFSANSEEIIDNPALGSKVFIAPEYVIALGGDSCGSTIYVVGEKYSFSVAYCDVDGKATSSEKLIELATGVKATLPTT
jgi:hypothetical protein